ncbi:AraC family transcriptional regulator [Saccharobesus litoralis]|uniref:AraC family transcriptional regulator n=1 Tax=Saccharobesus litoralis TaxID=2172099 RepID=A0A2S0VNH5_9ALTE|nr:helix-turn-helix transcriptional regulator [Saccharobesus litoralis]AWB65640.1 AraC family transcriptional regulator [Saccharobesus litoralis]
MNLISVIQQVQAQQTHLPFSVYQSTFEQRLLNVPIAKPLMVVVLNGTKQLGRSTTFTCSQEQFVFLADSPALDMRNIPLADDYFALLIEFDSQDINDLTQAKALNPSTRLAQNYYIADVCDALAACLQQFIESALWAPQSMWPARRIELLTLLCHLGHDAVLNLFVNTKLSSKLQTIYSQSQFSDVHINDICQQLAMSESTLRRKLKAEGTGLQAVKDQARLGQALHLLQTTDLAIGLVAEQCGYSSQSRFTDRFKSRFGLTPSDLRKTRITE